MSDQQPQEKEDEFGQDTGILENDLAENELNEDFGTDIKDAFDETLEPGDEIGDIDKKLETSAA